MGKGVTSGSMVTTRPVVCGEWSGLPVVSEQPHYRIRGAEITRPRLWGVMASCPADAKNESHLGLLNYSHFSFSEIQEHLFSFI